MAWTYNDWRSAGAAGSAARLTALRAHIAEVSQKIGAEVASDGKSRSTAELNTYLGRLEVNLKDEESSPRNRVNGGISRVRLGQPQ